MNLDLQRKHALVGGSSKGIGRAVAIELAKLGADVTVMARSEDTLQEVVQLLDSSQGQSHDYLIIDVEDGAALSEQVVEWVAEKPVHILVNNTGGPPGGPITDAALADFGQAFYNHLLTNHRLMQAVLPDMKAASYGRIINVISTSVKQPLAGLGVSNTIRAAVANWAKTLASEVGSFGITVNNVLPGATATQRLSSIIESKAAKAGQDIKTIEKQMKSSIPLGRFAEAEEVAAAIAFLASPAAAYISGINLPVDGGRLKCL